MVTMLYADGHSADEVSVSLGISLETVRSYIANARLKYKNADRPAHDVIKLRARMVEDGFLSE